MPAFAKNRKTSTTSSTLAQIVARPGVATQLLLSAYAAELCAGTLQ